MGKVKIKPRVHTNDKTEFVGTKVSERLKKKVASRARRSRLSISDFVRELLEREVG